LWDISSSKVEISSLITNGKGEYYDFIKDVFELPVLGAVTPGRGNNGMCAKESLSFTLLALKCDCADATGLKKKQKKT